MNIYVKTNQIVYSEFNNDAQNIFDEIIELYGYDIVSMYIKRKNFFMNGEIDNTNKNMITYCKSLVSICNFW